MTEGAPRRTVGQLDPRLRGKRTHMCCACDFPISVYGRCAPCLHAFCLTCAAKMPRCIICGAAITKLERIPAEAGLFISPLTLQGYRTEADLANHARKLHAQLQELLAVSEGSGLVGAGGMQGMAGMGAMNMPAQGMQGMHAPHYAHQRQQQQQQQRPPGWKPPPPPGAPPPGTGSAGYGRGQQQQAPRQGHGSIMRPR